MIHDLAIYGAGGFGREMALMVEQMNAEGKEWEIIGFFDDGKKAGTKVDGLPVLGNGEALNAWEKPLSLVVALADPLVRRAVVERINNKKITFPVMIHPKSLAGSSRNKFGRGTIVTAGCVLTLDIELQDFVIVNLSSTIGHDVRVGAFSTVMPSTNISGGVVIGSDNLIGTGAQILQSLTIGDGCKIGAGAVVTKDIPSGVVVKGVPGRW